MLTSRLTCLPLCPSLPLAPSEATFVSNEHLATLLTVREDGRGDFWETFLYNSAEVEQSQLCLLGVAPVSMEKAAPSPF